MGLRDWLRKWLDVPDQPINKPEDPIAEVTKRRQDWFKLQDAVRKEVKVSLKSELLKQQLEKEIEDEAREQQEETNAAIQSFEKYLRRKRKAPKLTQKHVLQDPENWKPYSEISLVRPQFTTPTHARRN